MIDILRITVASLALIGCIFIIFTHLLLELYKQFTNRLILYLTISGIAHSVCYLANNLKTEGHACSFLGWLLYYSDIASLFWICCITFNIFMNAVKMKQTIQHELKYHILSWGVSLIISLAPVFADTYGPAGVWCWIIGKGEWRFGMWYGPLFFTVCVLFLIYPYIIWTVHKLDKAAALGELNPIKKRAMVYVLNDVKPSIAYPIVYLLVSVFPLVNRIQNGIADEPSFAIVVLHAISSPLQGALNAVVFALSKDVLSRLRLSQLKITAKSIWEEKESD